MASAAETVEPRLRARDQTLALTPLPRPAWVEGDPVRLVQIVDNLLTNASKYSPDGAAITVETEVGDRHATVRVIDPGIGIPAQVLPHVFDLFVQDPRALDRSQGGLGIGLALVRRLAELHGGEISASSGGQGLGATFTLRLPTIAAPAAAADRPETSPTGGAARILVVDDDRDAADSTAVLLRMYGHEVAVAGTGATATSLAREFRPQVVVLDLGLPDEDGYATAARLRLDAHGDAPAIVALTGFGQPSDLARSREAGFDEHLVKPVDPDLLLEAIERRAQRGRARSG